MTNPLPAEVEMVLDGLKRAGDQWLAICPTHADRNPSLALRVTEEGKLLVNCFAGCDPKAVLAAIGYEPPERPQRGEWTPNGEAVAVYDYRDESGELLYQVLRTADKHFSQRRPDATAKSGWRYSLGATRRVLYRLPELVAAVAEGRSVCIAEGERDVQALVGAGFVATTNSGGAGKWRPEFAQHFIGTNVTIFADKDEPGQKHARDIARSLEGVAASWKIVEAADPHKDIAAHLGAGLTPAQVVTTATSAGPVRVDLAPDLLELLDADEPEYDWLIPGLLERGDRVILTGSEGFGKALALDTPIPTPKGWTTMGELAVGEEVFGADGRPVRVGWASEVQYGRPCYRVWFSDGANIVADGEHQWLTETLRAREVAAKASRRAPGVKLRGTDQRHKRQHFPRVVTTAQIAETLWARGGHAINHSVAVTSPVEYPCQELPVDPYVLGAWLGDGTSRAASLTIHPDDRQILDRIEAAGVPVRKTSARFRWSLSDGTHTGPRSARLAGRLRELGVFGNKHIPRSYLQSSPAQRLALLQGLMDTDGSITPDGSACEFSVTCERLALDVQELLLSLGIKVAMHEGEARLEGRLVGTRWRLTFTTDLPVFHLQRKAQRLRPLRTRRALLRYIVAVEPVDSVPVRCIGVENDDHLYLAGREFIPTHNSTWLRQLTVMFASGVHPVTFEVIDPVRVLVVDCENGVRLNRRKYRPLVAAMKGLGRRHEHGNLRIIHRPEGMALDQPQDAAWLLERVTAHRPDMLVLGPLYRLHVGPPKEEEVARAVVAAIDAARIAANCAVFLEAHSPHPEAGRNRSVRPLGSSLYLRWPEFGLGLRLPRDSQTEDFAELNHWRGDRDERNWPPLLRRTGQNLPWEPADWDIYHQMTDNSGPQGVTG